MHFARLAAATLLEASVHARRAAVLRQTRRAAPFVCTATPGVTRERGGEREVVRYVYIIIHGERERGGGERGEGERCGGERGW